MWTGKWDHSARFVSPAVSGGALDPNASTLTTKNGMGAEKTDTLTGIIGVYGPAGIGVFRHR